MANNFLTPEMVANEALYQLEQTRVFSRLVNNDYSKEFVKVGDTVNVRKGAVLFGDEFEGTVKRQDVVEDSIPVKIDRIADVSVKISSKDLTLDVKDFGAQVLTPAIRGINRKIDSDVGAMLVELAQKIITEDGNNPMKDVAAIGNWLDNQNGPLEDRHIVFNPDHKYRYATTDNLSKAAYAGTNETLRNAILGDLYGAHTYMSQNVPYSLADTVGTATAYKVEFESEGHVKLTNLDTATATVKKGDGFIHEGRVYRFAEDKTGAASAINKIKLARGSKDFPAGAAQDVILLKKRTSIGFHRDAITLATRPLEPALGGVQSAVAVGDNFAIRVTFDYNSNTKENYISLDVAYGLKGLHEDLIAVIKG